MERSSSFCSGVVICILILVLAHGTQAQYSGGSGTAQDPYRIATAADLVHPRARRQGLRQALRPARPIIDLDPNLPGGKVFDKAVKDIWWILDGKDYPRLWWQLEEK